MAHGRRPECRVILVTVVALARRRNMTGPGRLARRRQTVVAGGACSGRSWPMGECGARPDRRRFVACIALRGRRGMLGVLALCPKDVAVVTIRTHASHCRVRIGGAGPHAGGFVAGVALCSRANVIHWLGQRIDAGMTTAVATRTLSRHGRRMRHVGRCKMRIRRPVTGVASQRCRDVGDVLAGCVGPVVTGRAATGDYPTMEVDSRLPRRRSMAGIARLRGRDVRTVLGLGIHRHIAAAMAGYAGSSRPGMAHGGRLERCVVLVAGIALGSSRNMPRSTRFSWCSDTVMAGRTGSDGTRRVGVGSPQP